MHRILATVILMTFISIHPSLRAEDAVHVYPHLVNPRQYPDDARRAVKPPSWDTFDNQTQFTALRGFSVENNRVVGFEEELDKYTVQHDLGRVIWPSYPLVFAENLNEFSDSIVRRKLYLFDLWGYVPGAGPGGSWEQFIAPRAALDLFESKLGERWLGMDNGEQDGRYIGGYADQMTPMRTDRFGQYLNFQRHFERMGDDLGQKLSTLVSLSYGHYFLKEGTYTAIGAETAQALPNSQVYYAFIRGAGKQYGVPWFGNASVFNRWGYKAYGTPGKDHSTTKGTSLNLLKRLMYSHIFYNASFVGFESGWFDGEELSPIGRIQESAQQWVRAHGQPGVQHTPIALLLDFNAGWTFPRHLYSDKIYRVWGNIPYTPGDYWTEALVDLLYPGYQDASYYHNEQGFLSPTPFGDAADVLLSDAPDWILGQYPVVVLAGGIEPSAELHDKLESYVKEGGHLVITAGNLAQFPRGLLGATAATPTATGRDMSIECADGPIVESLPFEQHTIAFPSDATVLAKGQEQPLAVQWNADSGKVTLLASDFGVARDEAVQAPIPNPVDAPLAKPYRMLTHVQRVLEGIFRKQMLFSAGPDLSVITCRKAPGEYTLCVLNNRLEALPLHIESLCGPMTSLTELPLDVSEKRAVGFLPEGFETSTVGASTPDTIAGADVRVFEAKVQESRVLERPATTPTPAPHGRALPLGEPRLLKEEILRRPTFFQHFDSAVVDWRYLRDRDPEALRREAAWIKRQQLKLYVDATTDINLFPGMRLTLNDAAANEADLKECEALLEKMPLLGAKDLMVCLHRQPEVKFTAEETWSSFHQTLGELASRAQAKGITVYLAITLKAEQNLEKVATLLREIGAPNLKLAPSIALLARQKQGSALPSELLPQIGLWLASATAQDFNGKNWSAQMPLCCIESDAPWREWLAATPGIPVALNAVYSNLDDEYRDAFFLDSVGTH